MGLLDGSSALLEHNLKLIRGIGSITEARLKSAGHHDLDSLSGHPRWGDQADRVKKLIRSGCYRELRELGACDAELLGFFRPEESMFLDIETVGLWASQPLFLIGLLFQGKEGLTLRQFFARHYREEKAVLEAVNNCLQ